MEPREFDTLFAVENHHWWFLGMRRITVALVARVFRGRTDLEILDAGCGTGGGMTYLAPFGSVTGCDLFPAALALCRRRGLTRLARATVTRLPFADGSFDLVTSFDVLCHRQVGDWAAAVVEFHRVLREGGRVLLRLPAYDWLRGRHDEAVHTRHRFTAGEVAQALVAAGFSVEKLSYANTLLFPLALGQRLAARFAPRAGAESDLGRQPPRWLGGLLRRVLSGEAPWLERHGFPFGLTVVAIGRKEAPVAPGSGTMGGPWSRRAG